MKKTLAYILGFFASLAPKRIQEFLIWPVASRIFGFDFSLVVTMKDGFRMRGSMQDILSRSILFLGPFKKDLWEPETLSVLRTRSKDANNILIAGAHMGYLVLIAAHACRGHVHTFEPIESLHAMAKENIALNPELAKRITLTEAALGETEGTLKLYAEDIRSSAIPYSGGHVAHQNIVTAPLTTIDVYAKSHGVQTFDLILLDVEGFEWYALNGASTTLVNKPDLILEVSPRVLAHTEVTPIMMLEKFQSLGYTISFIDDYERKVVAYTSETAEYYFKRDYVNVLAYTNL